MMLKYPERGIMYGGGKHCSLDDSLARMALLRRVGAITNLALLAVTWRLWTPQTAFPQVPLIAAGNLIPSAVVWLLAGCMVAALAAVAIAPSTFRWWRAALALYLAAVFLLVLADASRLQAWVYQGLLWAIVLLLVPAARAETLLTTLVASIYCWSAVSKFDYEFIHTQGPRLFAALLGLVGVDSSQAPARLLTLGAWLMPAMELVAAAAIGWPRCGSWRAAPAVLLHGLLLGALGPFGLGHQPGVLIWNVGFLGQVIVLACRRSQPADIAGTWGDVGSAVSPRPVGARGGAARYLANAIVALAILAPLGAGSGWCDRWPAWALYSPAASRVTVLLQKSAADRLPTELQEYLVPADPNAVWQIFRIDTWSLRTLGTPVYPEARVQLGVAAGLAQRLGLNRQVRAVLYTSADRWTGKRAETITTGLSEIEAAGRRFWLNWRPRQPPTPP